jgi:DNA ligase-1
MAYLKAMRPHDLLVPTPAGLCCRPGRFGPVREVVHERDNGLVLEVAFEGLARSTRHKSGLAMRFPRINRLRWDKRPADADRIESLERLLTASAARDA